MNYPESELLTGLIAAINTKIPGRPVYTVPPKDLVYPYILINQIFMSEIGPKNGFIYKFEPLIQVIYKDQSSKTNLINDMNKIHNFVGNGADITVQGYTVICVELISTNTTEELYDFGRLDVGLIRLNIELK